MSTIFSKIIANEIPSYKIYEDEYVVAFLDINPIQKGHTLVVPKVEVDQFFDVSEKMFDHMMHRVRYLAQVIKAKTNCERVCVFIEGYPRLGWRRRRDSPTAPAASRPEAGTQPYGDRRPRRARARDRSCDAHRARTDSGGETRSPRVC